MLKWLVVGLGDIAGKRVIPAILAEPRSHLAGIVTRNPKPAEQSIASLHAGGHDLCEKPMAMNYPQATARREVAPWALRTIGEGTDR
jgi:1,5-anhydro-D-fructose reductase (1,5-anhydro-D-mannitol-forming)